MLHKGNAEDSKDKEQRSSEKTLHDPARQSQQGYFGEVSIVLSKVCRIRTASFSVDKRLKRACSSFFLGVEDQCVGQVPLGCLCGLVRPVSRSRLQSGSNLTDTKIYGELKLNHLSLFSLCGRQVASFLNRNLPSPAPHYSPHTMEDSLRSHCPCVQLESSELCRQYFLVGIRSKSWIFWFKTKAISRGQRRGWQVNHSCATSGVHVVLLVGFSDG